MRSLIPGSCMYAGDLHQRFVDAPVNAPCDAMYEGLMNSGVSYLEAWRAIDAMYCMGGEL